MPCCSHYGRKLFTNQASNIFVVTMGSARINTATRKAKQHTETRNSRTVHAHIVTLMSLNIAPLVFVIGEENRKRKHKGYEDLNIGSDFDGHWRLARKSPPEAG